MLNQYQLTESGKKKLEVELSYLKNEKLKELSDQIKEHRGFCDFSDNASFNQTLDQQARINDRISSIEEMLLNAEIIESSDKDTSKVQLGSTVTFIELPDGLEESYTLVGKMEVDPLINKISINSPIGKALLGNEKADEIEIDTPSGKMKVKILNVE